MKKFLAFPIIALAAGCVPAEQVQLSAAEQGELSTALAGRTPGEPMSCVTLRDIRGNRSVGEGVILFEGRGDTVYLNRPIGGCPSLELGRALVTRTPTGRLCSGEIATVVHNTTGIHEGSCSMGEFVPYRRLG